MEFFKPNMFSFFTTGQTTFVFSKLLRILHTEYSIHETLLYPLKQFCSLYYICALYDVSVSQAFWVKLTFFRVFSLNIKHIDKTGSDNNKAQKKFLLVTIPSIDVCHLTSFDVWIELYPHILNNNKKENQTSFEIIS